jgi:hypothetical protein
MAQKTGEYVPYAHITKGKRIYFVHKGAKRQTRIEGIKFYDRDYTIPEAYLEKVLQYPLDSLIKLPNYDEVKTFLLQLRDMGNTTPAPEPEKKSTNLCPANLTFGESFGTVATCIECTVKEDCIKQKMVNMQGGFTAPATGGSRLPRESSPPPVADEDIPF